SDHQSWRNSRFSIYYRDGKPAGGAIAPACVQAYMTAALEEWSGVLRAIGDTKNADHYSRSADLKRSRFQSDFWSPEHGIYGMAMDDDRLCIVKGSHLGHCLFAGMANAETAPALAEALMQPTSFNGWGVRTVASDQARYNPLAPHHGACWPHDCALACSGLARYGYKAEAREL